MGLASDKMRVGILGMGRASAFMNPVRAYPHAALAAVCDKVPEKTAERFRALGVDPSGIEVYQEYETMLEKEILLCIALWW